MIEGLYGQLLGLQFKEEKKNKAQTSDIIYIRTQSDWLYLADILDLYSPKIVD